MLKCPHPLCTEIYTDSQKVPKVWKFCLTENSHLLALLFHIDLPPNLAPRNLCSQSRSLIFLGTTVKAPAGKITAKRWTSFAFLPFLSSSIYQLAPSPIFTFPTFTPVLRGRQGALLPVSAFPLFFPLIAATSWLLAGSSLFFDPPTPPSGFLLQDKLCKAL